jgi:arylsulfatase A-like enzyme
MRPRNSVGCCCRADVGWANVGWNRKAPTKEVVTPVLDSLVAEGIELTQFYTFKYCSPTRSSLQSGRNPIHVNVLNSLHMYNPNSTDTAGVSGIALNFTTLPEKMRLAGYVPHAVGKWDCGGATLRQTPAGRGYESWLGYWSACNDYWNMVPMCGPKTCTVDGVTTPMVSLKRLLDESPWLHFTSECQRFWPPTAPQSVAVLDRWTSGRRIGADLRPATAPALLLHPTFRPRPDH